MIVAGWDPSTEGAAFAVIECGVGESGLRRFVANGEIGADPRDALDIMMNNSVELVAVERPSGIHIPPPKPGPGILERYAQALMMARSSGTALMNASYIAGVLATLARAVHDCEYRELAPQQWRAAIGAARATKDTNQDAMVKSAIEQLVIGWPKRSNTHVRDAAGVALAAYWQVRATRRAAPGPEVFGG